MAAWLSSTSIFHQDLLPHISSVCPSAFNSSPHPGIAPQSLNSSSQPLHLPGVQCSCMDCVWLWQGLSDSHSISVQFSLSVVSNYLWPHEPQHARPPCPSLTPRVHPNPCPSSQWCHPTISSSVVPFSSCPQSFPASGSFQMSQLFTSDCQSIGVSASASVLPMNTQDWSPLGWTGWISFQSRGLSSVFSNTTVQKHRFFSTKLSL